MFRDGFEGRACRATTGVDLVGFLGRAARLVNDLRGREDNFFSILFVSVSYVSTCLLG